jgi:hypothetical protein
MIIGITGKARSGKDTVAAHLVKHYGFKRIGFADAVKDMALDINPLLTNSGLRLNQAIRTLGWETAKDVYPEVRRFLQAMGTEGVRNRFGQNAWVDIVEDEVYRNSNLNWVIPDVRFFNEARFIGEANGTLIRVQRFTDDITDEHASECELDDARVDYGIMNEDRLSDLYMKTDIIMHDLGIERIEDK